MYNCLGGSESQWACEISRNLGNDGTMELPTKHSNPFEVSLSSPCALIVVVSIYLITESVWTRCHANQVQVPWEITSALPGDELDSSGSMPDVFNYWVSAWSSNRRTDKFSDEINILAIAKHCWWCYIVKERPTWICFANFIEWDDSSPSYFKFPWYHFTVISAEQISTDQIWDNVHNWRASPDLWLEEYMDILRRQHRTEHGQLIQKHPDRTYRGIILQ